MSILGLTSEEHALAAQMATDPAPRGSRLWFYLSALVPWIGFGLFGISRNDLIALAIGFVGVVLLFCWRIADEMKVAPVFRSLCAKIDAIEREGDGERARTDG